MCASARREIETRDGPETRLRQHAPAPTNSTDPTELPYQCVGKNDQRVRRRVRVRVMRIRVSAW